MKGFDEPILVTRPTCYGPALEDVRAIARNVLEIVG